MRRKINLTLLILALLIGLPYYWLLLDNRPGESEPKPLTIAELRTLAASLPGPAPTAVEVELVGYRHLPRNLFAAGHGMKRALIGVMAWQLPVPGYRPVIIDTGLHPIDAETMGMTAYWPERQGKVDRAMAGAGLILATHEHPDHLGALARAGGAPLLKAAMLNAGQLPQSPLAAQLPWRGERPPAKLSAAAPHAVAPGVVVIPAPSHTAGSQMVFVRLADGREILFAGDIATLAASWQDLRARSRLVGDYLAPENRGEVYAWLKTIRILKGQAPEMVVIPGHDYEWIASNPQARALVHTGFRQ